MASEFLSTRKCMTKCCSEKNEFNSNTTGMEDRKSLLSDQK